MDSPLEGDGFELLVPRHKSRGFPQHFRALGYRRRGEIAEFLYEITRYYGNAYTREQIPGFPVHDLLVMIYALRPALFKTRLLHVDVETEGALTEGMTVADFRPYSKVKPNVNVCLKADADAIFDWYEKVIM